MKILHSPTKQYLLIVFASLGTLVFQSLVGGMSADLFNQYTALTLGWEGDAYLLVYGILALSFPVQSLTPIMAARFGVKRVMQYSVLLLMVATLALAIFLSIMDPVDVVWIVAPLLFLIEVAYSVSYGGVWSAWISKLVEPDVRTKLLAVTRLLSQLTLILTFALVWRSGGILETKDYVLALFICGVYWVGVGFVVWRFIDGNIMLSDNTSVTGAASLWVCWKSMLADRRCRPFIFDAIFQPFIGLPMWSVLIVSVWGLSPRHASIALILKSAFSIAVLALLAWCLKRVTTVKLFQLSASGIFACLLVCLVVAISGVIQGTSRSVEIFNSVLLLIPLFFSCKSIFSISTTSLSMEIVPERYRVALYTIQDMLSSLSVQLGAVLGGALVTLHSQIEIGSRIVDKAALFTCLWLCMAILMFAFVRRSYSRVVDFGLN